MIRDPSDGTVKSSPVISAPQNTAEREPSVMPVSPGADTGLPPEDRASKEYTKRLRYWREWLIEYHAKKGKT